MIEIGLFSSISYIFHPGTLLRAVFKVSSKHWTGSKKQIIRIRGILKKLCTFMPNAFMKPLLIYSLDPESVFDWYHVHKIWMTDFGAKTKGRRFILLLYVKAISYIYFECSSCVTFATIVNRS